ncbi:ATP-binding protein [Roseateles asaccharophilus]|uniref:histidine kinase n=1 Tax=Roseateles asaccharophilus TaxID=582607 RepID=A0ABU2AHZ0_9BURK|nr:ATP-binding protein [Roseateles asaccharophilus]MDR7335598.1 signal transduction histidine kinase [Roseateles asaccharophilus]
MKTKTAPEAATARRLRLFPLIAAALLCPALAQAQSLAGPDWSGTVRGWVAAMLALMATVVGLISSLHSRERPANFLVGMMLSWVVLRAATVPSAAGLRPLLMTLLVLCGVQYLLRQMNWKRDWIDYALLIQCLVVPASLLLAGGQVGVLGWIWHDVLSLELIAAMGWALWLRWQRLKEQPDAESAQDFKLMLVLLPPTMLALLADMALVLVSEPLWQIASPWLTLTLPLLMLALGLQLVNDVAQARVDAEKRTAALDQRMADRIAEVERSHSQLAEQKLEQVTERERKRIAADLHDDLGAKLLTIVHTSESDRISTLAREALEEMRLSVRGLTGKPVHLIDAMGDWRAEVVSRLGQANILAEWKSPAEDIEHTFQARSYVQTTRILRESVSNIIKHSGATNATISAAVQDGDFILTIQDNGQGIPTELDGRLDRGHGMASMKSRAKQMHGQCLVESGPGWGTVIRLTIPL